nr:MAG TPA: intraflagellar transport complex B protein [Caudoviricetes sp.]
MTKRLICSILDIPYYVGYKRLGEVYGVCRI